MYQGMLARDFVRFTALTERGTATPFEQLTLPPGERVPQEGASGDPFRRQQLEHFGLSVRYSREALGLGVRGRRRERARAPAEAKQGSTALSALPRPVRG
jgi:hypothetical protein